MNNHQILKYERLFRKFSRIEKKEEILPTYMEIAGFPHFENVASNILAFFINPKGKHGLKDLLLKSIFDLIGSNESNLVDFGDVSVFREYVVDDSKRIDLIVECSNFVINIENKIFHHLNNDLNLYETVVKRKFKKENYYNLVLSLKKESVSDNYNDITYEELFEKIKANLGSYVLKANKTYVSYLLDFIQTIEGHYKMEEINKEMFAFLVENKQELDELEKERNKMNEALQRTLAHVRSQVPNEAKNVRDWIYDKTWLVYDFTIDNLVFAINVVFGYTDVKIFVGGRSVKAKSILNKLAVVKKNNIDSQNNIIYLEETPFFELDTAALAEKISGYLNQLYFVEETNEASSLAENV